MSTNRSNRRNHNSVGTDQREPQNYPAGRGQFVTRGYDDGPTYGGGEAGERWNEAWRDNGEGANMPRGYRPGEGSSFASYEDRGPTYRSRDHEERGSGFQSRDYDDRGTGFQGRNYEERGSGFQTRGDERGMSRGYDERYEGYRGVQDYQGRGYDDRAQGMQVYASRGYDDRDARMNERYTGAGAYPYASSTGRGSAEDLQRAFNLQGPRESDEYGAPRRTSMSGRGPKNYTRTDQRIQEEVCDALTAHHDIDPSEVEVRVENGEVILTGTVEERAMKHRIENLVGNIAGVRDVMNQLRVQRNGTGVTRSARSSDAGESQGTTASQSGNSGTQPSSSRNGTRSSHA